MSTNSEVEKKEIRNKIENEAKSLITRTEKQVVGFKVNSQPTLVMANNYLVQITSAEKQVTDRERQILNPLNQAKKSIIDFFRPIKERFAFLKSKLKVEMGNYVAKIEVEESKKKVEIEKKIETGEITADKAFKVLQKFEEKKEAVIVKTNKVVQIFAPDKLPDQYWIIDEVRVRRDALVGLLGEIQGVKVVEEKIIVGKK